MGREVDLHTLSICAGLLLGAVAAGPSPVVVPAPPSFSITVAWTAPGDDGSAGRAAQYDLRYSTTPINELNFAQAHPVAGVPVPGLAGSLQSAVVEDLAANTEYYFALKTCDEAGNWSPLSNVAHFPDLTTDVAGPPTALGFSAPWPNPARTEARCTLSLPRAAVVEVDVFSVAGRHVRSLASGLRPAGHSEVGWDLKDESGARVAAGLYLVRARLDGRTWNRRVTVVR